MPAGLPRKDFVRQRSSDLRPLSQADSARPIRNITRYSMTSRDESHPRRYPKVKGPERVEIDLTRFAGATTGRRKIHFAADVKCGLTPNIRLQETFWFGLVGRALRDEWCAPTHRPGAFPLGRLEPSSVAP